MLVVDNLSDIDFGYFELRYFSLVSAVRSNRNLLRMVYQSLFNERYSGFHGFAPATVYNELPRSRAARNSFELKDCGYFSVAKYTECVKLKFRYGKTWDITSEDQLSPRW